ncbi:MAG: carotenoid oxygenase family protein [Proteobacteria bacterium]|nr:carotenoid oxygenase family protein [Pseudomonadota bacterium]
MSRPFPTDDPYLNGNFAPWPMEGEVRDIEIEGEVPRELAGTLYRNGPNPQFAPRGRYHWFDGEGMIHAFRFENGRVDYRNRWVRTERFVREREAGEALFGGLANAGASDESVAGVSPNAANTNIVSHAGKLLALWEAGLPYELDPDTLETRGTWDFAGKLMRPLEPEAQEALGMEAMPGIMTAHPKFDPETGEMLFFGYSPIPPFLQYHVVDASGKLVRSMDIEVPFPSMVHDFITTRDHVIFPIFPAVFDLSRMETGDLPIVWEPDRGTHIGIMPRDGGPEDVVWLDSDPCYVFHPMNAYTDANRIVAEVCRHPVLPLFDTDGEGPPILTRWEIDLAGGTVKESALDDCPSEFPRLDERYAGLDYRHGYAAGSDRPDGETALPEAIVHFDLKTGKRMSHKLDPGCACGEPIFVPRSADAPEGDGFLLATVYRGETNRSEVVVLDAQNVADAPLARVKLPHRVPYGFHGNWRPAE